MGQDPSPVSLWISTSQTLFLSQHFQGQRESKPSQPCICGGISVKSSNSHPHGNPN